MPSIPDPEQNILAVMPLHAITTLYGEQGLRARLITETQRLDDTPGQQKISDALELAARVHATDRRQREPYVNHVLRVALRIICHYEVRDADIICAALLHDAVEDHASDLAATGRPGAFAVLAARYGPQVAALVQAVTNPVYLSNQDRDQQYRAHVAASLSANPRARIIKVSDFTDNGVGLIHTTGPKLVRLASKYAPLVPVLADLIARPDTPLSGPAKARILDQLRTAQARFAAIAPPADREAEAEDSLRTNGLTLNSRGWQWFESGRVAGQTAYAHPCEPEALTHDEQSVTYGTGALSHIK